MAEESNIIAFPGNEVPGGNAVKGSSGKGFTDMRSELVDEASKIIPEPPVLINLVSRRVKQLNLGRAPLVRTDHRMGAADIALTEIIEKKISPDFPEGEE
ncbi:MAG: DNA-directed RNA polymerase subunit omega [Verrucomicrobiales bacterium]|nr:DNA-directed RNA polymerase subunit omega [Verrucomicrobiales bacterium]